MSAATFERAQANPVAMGIGLACLGFCLFTCMDTAIKWLSAGWPLHEIVFFNALFGLVPVLAYAKMTGGWRQLRTRRLSMHLLRGATALAGGFAAFYAYSVMPLADAYAILFCAPLLITALSVPVLGESVGWRRWSAVAVGFAGVLVMLRPGEGVMSLGTLGALVSALTYSVTVLVVRRFGASETRASFSFYGNLTSVAVAGAALAMFGGVVPTVEDLATIAVAGMLGGAAFIFVVNAYRHAPAAVVAPFQYTQMAWGAVFGFLLWGDLPDIWLGIGGALVVGSGLYILHRETVRGTAVAQAAPAAATKPA